MTPNILGPGFVYEPGGHEALILNIFAKNIGVVPATNIIIKTRLITVLGENGESNWLEIRKCERDQPIGSAVFPADEKQLRSEVAFADRRSRRISDTASFGFILVVCATYQSGSDGAVHSSRTLYALRSTAEPDKFVAEFGTKRPFLLKEQLGLVDIGSFDVAD